MWGHYLARGRRGERGILLCVPVRLDVNEIKTQQLKTRVCVRIDRSAPGVTAEAGYYLLMKDDFGHTFSSPIFNIACEHAALFFFFRRGTDANG